VAESEELHERLLRRGVPAVVLNAKNDAEEARVIAEAGKLSAVTVSTQMAGRGTDIRLGGSDEADHEKVVDLGGLHVVGTGRHNTERLDNQLRGRAGRQGDPGSSVFFSSWADDVVAANLESSKLPTQTDGDGRIVSPKSAGLLDHAQRVAEGRLLDVHANTWRYNQLIAQQRAIIVERRNALLGTAAPREELAALAPERYAQLAEDPVDLSEDRLETICRLIMLYHLDRGWAEHLAYLADIRESIHLRALGRQNPLDEFHRMAVDAFASLAADAIEAAQQTFETSSAIEDEPGIDLSKLARPTSTWTYMVHDNPLADDSLSALSLPGIFR
jgi:preprotein translocase subunit SecA